MEHFLRKTNQSTNLVSLVMLDFLPPKRTSLRISSDLTKSPDFSILFADVNEDIMEIIKKFKTTQRDVFSFQSF